MPLWLVVAGAAVVTLFAIPTPAVESVGSVLRLPDLDDWLERAELRLDDVPVLVAMVGLVVAASRQRANHFVVRQAVAAAEQRQREALAEITQQVIRHVHQPELMTPSAVRSMALGLEQRHGCPILTDKLIAEALRAAALDFELTTEGAGLVERLMILNPLVMHFDAEGPPLLSIAVVDRLGAYALSQPFAVRVLIGVLALLTFAIAVGILWPVFAVLYCLTLGALACVLIASRRARHFWSGQLPAAQPTLPDRLLRPRSPAYRLDMLWLNCHSRSPRAERFWHIYWGPIWEQPLIMFNTNFLVMHEYRLVAAMKVQREIAEYSAQIADGPPEARGELRERIAEAYGRLWVISGRADHRALHQMALRDAAQSVEDTPEPGLDGALTTGELRRRFHEAEHAFHRAGHDASVSVEDLRARILELERCAGLLSSRTGHKRWVKAVRDCEAALKRLDDGQPLFEAHEPIRPTSRG